MFAKPAFLLRSAFVAAILTSLVACSFGAEVPDEKQNSSSALHREKNEKKRSVHDAGAFDDDAGAFDDDGGAYDSDAGVDTDVDGGSADAGWGDDDDVDGGSWGDDDDDSWGADAGAGGWGSDAGF